MKKKYGPTEPEKSKTYMAAGLCIGMMVGAALGIVILPNDKRWLFVLFSAIGLLLGSLIGYSIKK